MFFFVLCMHSDPHFLTMKGDNYRVFFFLILAEKRRFICFFLLDLRSGSGRRFFLLGFVLSMDCSMFGILELKSFKIVKVCMFELCFVLLMCVCMCLFCLWYTLLFKTHLNNISISLFKSFVCASFVLTISCCTLPFLVNAENPFILAQHKRFVRFFALLKLFSFWFSSKTLQFSLKKLRFSLNSEHKLSASHHFQFS